MRIKFPFYNKNNKLKSPTKISWLGIGHNYISSYGIYNSPIYHPNTVIVSNMINSCGPYNIPKFHIKIIFIKFILFCFICRLSNGSLCGA